MKVSMKVKVRIRDSCMKVVTIPQYSGVCWFTSLLMVLLYSSGMRRLVIESLSTHVGRGQKEKELLSIFREIVVRHYSYEYKMRNKAYDFFAQIKPETMLAYLHGYNPNKFSFNISKQIGFTAEAYITGMLDFLHINKYIVLEAFPNSSQTGYVYVYSYLYSKINDPYNNMTELTLKVLTESQLKDRIYPGVADAVIIFVSDSKPSIRYPRHYKLMEIAGPISQVLALPGRRKTYAVDSLLLGSFNGCSMSHQIAGITCNGRRYIYNGWLRKAIGVNNTAIGRPRERPIPCELMECDWMDHNKTKNFILDTSACGIKKVNSPILFGLFKPNEYKKNPVFHFNKGSRTYIYTAA
jgi:hypothetical protein